MMHRRILRHPLRLPTSPHLPPHRAGHHPPAHPPAHPPTHPPTRPPTHRHPQPCSAVLATAVSAARGMVDCDMYHRHHHLCGRVRQQMGQPSAADPSNTVHVGYAWVQRKVDKDYDNDDKADLEDAISAVLARASRITLSTRTTPWRVGLFWPQRKGPPNPSTIRRALWRAPPCTRLALNQYHHASSFFLILTVPFWLQVTLNVMRLAREYGRLGEDGRQWPGLPAPGGLPQ